MEGPSIIVKFQEIQAYDNWGYQKEILDFITLVEADIDSDLNYYALIVDKLGILICSIAKNEIGNSSVPDLICSVKNTQQLTQKLQVIALSKMEGTQQFGKYNVEPYFYAITSRPPVVIEFDMADIDNVLVNKYFMINSENDNYIGTSSITVNKNFVMHLLINPDTMHQVIRVFCR